MLVPQCPLDEVGLYRETGFAAPDRADRQLGDIDDSREATQPIEEQQDDAEPAIRMPLEVGIFLRMQGNQKVPRGKPSRACISSCWGRCVAKYLSHLLTPTICRTD